MSEGEKVQVQPMTLEDQQVKITSGLSAAEITATMSAEMTKWASITVDRPKSSS